MPNEFWYTISSATHDLPYDAFTLGGGANKNVAVQIGGGRAGPATHDDDGSSVDSGGANRQAFNVDWPGPISVVTALTAGCRTRETGAGVQSLSQEFSNAGGTLSATFNTHDPGAAYADHGPIDVAAFRPGGGAWVAADFVDDKTTFPALVANAISCRATSVWGQLDYVPPTGGFAFLLGIAGLLPVLGTLVDHAQFMRYLAWRRAFHPRHTILTGDEVRRAWREIRAYRHPRFFFPAVA